MGHEIAGHTEIPNPATTITVKRFVEVQLSDGKTGGVLVDWSTIPPEEAGDFCFSQEFRATILPEETLLDRGMARVKNWLSNPTVPRYRTIPHS